MSRWIEPQGEGMNFKINEIFFSIQGRGPIRDQAQRGAGAQRNALCDLGVVGEAAGRQDRG
jgi:hypothetical protein